LSATLIAESDYSGFFMKYTDSHTRDNLHNFYEPVEMLGGWSFDHVEQIKTNFLYYYGKYKTGIYDDQGFRKFFYNVVKPTCDIATKFIDLDTKNIITSPVRNGDEMKVFFLQRRLRDYLVEHNFGELLNTIGDEFPKGHVVLKKVGKKFHKVNLANIRTNTASDYLKNSSFVYEAMEVGRGDMNKKWDTSELFALYPTQNNFVVYECYDKDGERWHRTVKADLFAKMNEGNRKSGTEANLNVGSDYLPSIVLLEDEVDKLPYRELKWEHIDGRWLGYGFPELLEDNQIATNEAENLERQGLMFTSLKLYQTRDEQIGGQNVLTDTRNGDILKLDSELTPVAMEERNLGAFNSTRGRWDTNTERKTFSFDIARGENLPSRTPVGVANLSAGMVTSFFELKRQKFALFIKELLYEDIIPDFRKDTAGEHEMMFAGSDEEIERLDNFLVESTVDIATAKRAEETGFYPSQAIRDEAKSRVRKQLKKKVNRYLKIMKDFYKDVKFVIDINIVGEGFDLGKNNEAMNFAMQTVATNPAILQNKTTRSIFFEILSRNGFSPVKLNLLSQDVDMTPVPVAGSMAGATPGQGQFGQVEQTI